MLRQRHFRSYRTASRKRESCHRTFSFDGDRREVRDKNLAGYAARVSHRPRAEIKAPHATISRKRNVGATKLKRYAVAEGVRKHLHRDLRNLIRGDTIGESKASAENKEKDNHSAVGHDYLPNRQAGGPEHKAASLTVSA